MITGFMCIGSCMNPFTLRSFQSYTSTTKTSQNLPEYC